MSNALNDLLRILDLEELERDRFQGQNETVGRPHLFGGQVMAQALAAAGATV
ncbi:MAG: acyl-CoA thioesterase II, partial [Deltaproteobacteria bacterium]|nr:acyl-CoA thioesterase II [Deltaproteobacteria bacterium]